MAAASKEQLLGKDQQQLSQPVVAVKKEELLGGGPIANLSANGSSKEGGASEGGLMAKLNTHCGSRKKTGNGGCAEVGIQRPDF